ncbi:MAG: hypothetical protein U1E65_35250 [Myxococcota bacterium]
MVYRAGYPGGAFVSTQPITSNSYIRAGATYAPPPGYQAAGPQPVNGASFRNYLEGVSAGRYFAGYSNFVRGHGVIKR